MAGRHYTVSDLKIRRIGELTEQGLTSIIIAERTGLTRAVVYELQVRHGFRMVVNPKKGGGKDEAV